jgi:aminoglycoside phosphotransferase (APT) family kinase protein
MTRASEAIRAHAAKRALMRPARRRTGLPIPTSHAEESTDVAARFIDYLRRRWGLPKLLYAVAPRPVPHGWETYTYRFRLRETAGLPAAHVRPLILRIYASPLSLSCARRERLIEDYLRPLGFPVAKCLLLEEDPVTLGGPFLVSEQAEGESFSDYLYRHPWRILDLPYSMGRLHAELHQIPINPALQKSTPFLERQLGQIERLIEENSLRELGPGHSWLRAHQPTTHEPPALLHLDYHPLNLLYDGAVGFTVLDWSQIDVGDRHADVAVAKMFMDCMQIRRPGWWQGFNFWGGRVLLRSGYIAGYRRCLPLDSDRLAYYCAWAALRRLCMYGACLKIRTTISWWKPASLGNLSQEHIDSFCRYFKRVTGVPITLSVSATTPAPAARDNSVPSPHAFTG